MQGSTIESSDVSGTENVVFGRVKACPKFEMSSTVMSGIKDVGFRWVWVLDFQVWTGKLFVVHIL